MGFLSTSTSEKQQLCHCTKLPSAHHAATSPYTFAEFLKNTLTSVLRTLYYNYTMVFYDPINFFLTITIYCCTVISMSVLTIVMDILSEAKVIKIVSEKWGQGLSVVNWGSPELFNDGSVYLKRASKSLSKVQNQGMSKYVGVKGSGQIQEKAFDSTVALAVLILSALVYERDESSWPASPNQRESMILKYAKLWDLKFVKASEMKVKNGGPYCGVFVGRNPGPFIIVVFKGTSPFDSAEWLSDATLTRTQASSYLYGEVHSGFFNKLFPQQNSTGKVQRSNPYIEILSCLYREALDIQVRGEPTKQIPLWVAGHSLGGALASIFFARLMKSKDDLDSSTTGLILQDGYTFGCPALGDGRFASEFASYSNLPYSNQSTLWRVVNDADIVARIPPGSDDPDILRFFTSSTLLNYTHIGQSLHVFTDGSNPKIQASRFGSIFFISNLIMNDGDTFWKRLYHGIQDFLPIGLTGDFPVPKNRTIITLGELFVPKLFADHFPSRYFWSLKRSLHGSDPIRAEDIKVVKEFLFKAIEEHYNPDWHSDIVNLEEYYLSNPRSHLLVGRDQDGVIIGTIAIRKYSNNFPAVNHLYNDETTSMVVHHFVAKSQRSKGVGTALLKAIETYARESGIDTMYLHTQTTIPGSLEYWLAKGYNIVLDVQDELGTVHLDKHLTRV